MTQPMPEEAKPALAELTPEEGSQPVGTGMGALVGGAAAGALLGTVAGPVGTVLGAAVGAVAGGMAGKDVADLLDPAVNERA